ncbi:MAG TPA: hypothetical protein VKD90_17940 [Gemmataceae bacterium]|nr:hypothetical protein [Gemmataceae bacterium]
MKGFTTKVLAGAVLAGGVLASGCHHGGMHGDSGMGCGDPCWPDRYANEARQSVVASFEPQVENGHILDQTIWNLHFDFNTEKLNAEGMDKLDQLARRRPHPDTRLFLQTARDIPFDAAKPADYGTRRNELDTKRIAAIKSYLDATLTGRPAAFDVQVHDPAPPGIDVNPGVAPRVYVPQPQDRARGAAIPPVPVTGVTGVQGGGAAAGAGGGTPPPPPPPTTGTPTTRPGGM